MADAGLQPMRLAIGRNVAAQAVRRFGLADAGNIVVLALDREQRHALDRGRIDRPAAMGHLALRQRVAHENGLDRLQIEFGREIHHGQIFVVEFLVLVRRVAVAAHQIAGTVACAPRCGARGSCSRSR